jgi:hypothetical protein
VLFRSYLNLPPSTFTGGTVTGATNFTDGLTANTISATTYLNLPPSTFTGGTVTGATNFTDGLTANTISATTYLNVPSITNGYGLSGTTTKQVSLTSTQVFATTTTSVNTATYLDVAGCSVTLAAGTWLITGLVVAASTNQIMQGFVAITTAANVVVAASAFSRPASGTANLNSPISVSWSVLVSPTTSTTYKLRAARGLTTHTQTYTIYDGTGYNTTNHANDVSDLGTNILAIRLS